MKSVITVIKLLVLVHIILGFGLLKTASAVPAAPIVVEIQQPDGTHFSVVTKGDEWNSWTETTDGYTIAKDKNGYWRYVKRYVGKTPILHTNRANKPAPAKLQPHIKPSEKRPPHAPPHGSGEPEANVPIGAFSGKVLFILTEFNDKKGTTQEASWATFISNNIADFYTKTSHGKVTLSPANETSDTSDTANNGVVGWVNVGYNHPNTSGNVDGRNQKLTKDAILAADPYVDFAVYDTNGDGYVDSNELAVVVIVAGYEASYGNYTPSIWAHAWLIYLVTPPVVDGVTVGAYHSNMTGGLGYSQFGEIQGDHQATVGVMVHEIGHQIFYFPDLYDYDSSSSGIGGFCVMAAGSWGGKSTDQYAGQTPVLASAFIKAGWGWVNAPQGSGTVSLNASGDSTAT